MEPRQVTILHGTTFVVSDVRGDVHGSPQEPEGLFYRDMRHLSRWEVRLDGSVPEVVGAETVGNEEAVFLLAPGAGTMYRSTDVTLLRRRRIHDGMSESFELANHTTAPVTVELSVRFDADFADIFDVKDGIRKTGHRYRRLGPGEVAIGYERADFRRETRIRAEGAAFTGESLTFHVTVPPARTWHVSVELTVIGDRTDTRTRSHQRNLQEWLDDAPRLQTPHRTLELTYRQSLIDLAALRFHLDTMPDAALPAAGVPWFMALFGRDSLTVSYQSLPFTPVLCRDALRALAARQADGFDDFRDAEPGKILHELRHGDLTYFHERPQSPYYGSADATPLFLIVLDEYERWTGDRALVSELEPAARAALRWVEEYGDPDGDGFIEYDSRNAKTGLVNQCWKDSWNSIVHPDGRLAKLPRATCEIQGYAYDARRRTARLARECWDDPELADRLERDAADLRRRFVDAFWLPEEGFYALALDGDERPVRTLASNMGHLLWSGIVPDEHVDSVVAHLMSDAMFSGWGIRTLACGQPVYSPMEYHNGTVWPHDSALIAAGLARYGRRAEAGRVVQAVIEAAGHFGHRLPEALVGMPRTVTSVPMRYPTACSPQAWATAAPLLCIRVLLGLEPSPDGLLNDPWVPEALAPLTLDDVPGRRGREQRRVNRSSNWPRVTHQGGGGSRAGSSGRCRRCRGSRWATCTGGRHKQRPERPRHAGANLLTGVRGGGRGRTHRLTPRGRPGSPVWSASWRSCAIPFRDRRLCRRPTRRTRWPAP